MKHLLFILSLLIIQCTDNSDHSTFKDCKDFSASYTALLKNSKIQSSILSWKDISDHHQDLTQKLVQKWPQDSHTINQFSEYFHTFFRTRIWLKCGLFQDSEILPPSKAIESKIEPGVHKISFISSDFQKCIFNEWLSSETLIFQSCFHHFSQE